MQINYFLLFISLLFFSCTKEIENKDNNLKIDAGLVGEFILKNKYSVIDGKYYFAFRKKDGGIKVDSFIEHQLQEKLFFDSIGNFKDDTLFTFIGLENFNELVSKEENKRDEIIRLVKSTFAFGLSDMIIIQGHKKPDVINLKSYKVKFDLDCNIPPYSFKDGKDFTSKCFKLEESEEKNLSTKEWEELKKIIQETEFKYTAYFDRGITICDGSNYSISYSDGSQYEDKIFEIERSCPSEKTAIFLVSDKLIKMKNGS